jgi:hypothetical protein
MTLGHNTCGGLSMTIMTKKSATRLALAAGLCVTCFAGRAAADPVLNANYLGAGLTLNGTVDAAKYGGGPAISADFSNLSAGNPSRLLDLTAGTFVTQPASALSYDLYAAYSNTTLYLGFVVRDDHVVTNPGNSIIFNSESDMELFIGGNRVGNNFRNFGFAASSKQAFQLAADPLGRQFTQAGGAFTNSAWATAASAVTATGYSIEFGIPLDLIDTELNGVFTPAHAGSLLRFNVGTYKLTAGGHVDYGILDHPFPVGLAPPRTNSLRTARSSGRPTSGLAPSPSHPRWRWQESRPRWAPA